MDTRGVTRRFRPRVDFLISSVVCIWLILAVTVVPGAFSGEEPCDGGWYYVSYGGSARCYYVSTTDRDFSNAKDSCIRYNATLASIATKAESEALADLFMSNQDDERFRLDNYWIGLSRPNRTGPWQWLDGSEYDWQNWDDSQPEPHDVCARAVYPGNLQWRGTVCTNKYGRICEKAPKNTPITTATASTTENSTTTTRTTTQTYTTQGTTTNFPDTISSATTEGSTTTTASKPTPTKIPTTASPTSRTVTSQTTPTGSSAMAISTTRGASNNGDSKDDNPVDKVLIGVVVAVVVLCVIVIVIIVILILKPARRKQSQSLDEEAKSQTSQNQFDGPAEESETRMGETTEGEIQNDAGGSNGNGPLYENTQFLAEQSNGQVEATDASPAEDTKKTTEEEDIEALYAKPIKPAKPKN